MVSCFSCSIPNHSIKASRFGTALVFSFRILCIILPLPMFLPRHASVVSLHPPPQFAQATDEGLVYAFRQCASYRPSFYSSVSPRPAHFVCCLSRFVRSLSSPPLSPPSPSRWRCPGGNPFKFPTSGISSTPHCALSVHSALFMKF